LAVYRPKGKIIVDGLSAGFSNFTEQGYAIASDKNGKYGTIDKGGKWLIDTQFKDAWVL
jgi:hypothetical protein